MPLPDLHFLVCANERPPGAPKPSCGAGCGLDLYHRLKDLVRERGLKETVLVTRTGCLKHCKRGATVAVWPANHWYGQVEIDDADALLDAELGGSELERRRMPPGPWE